MITFAVFLIVIAAAIVLTMLFERNARAGRVVAIIGAVAAWPLLVLCRLASQMLDLVLRPSGTARRIASGWYVLWVGVGLIPMIGFFALRRWPLPLPEFVNPGYLLIVGGLFHVFVVGAAYLVVHDDFDVMDGVVDGDSRRIRGARNVTRPAAIAISIALVAAYAIAIAYWLGEVEGIALFDKRPQTGWVGLDYILVGLRALPTDFLLGLIDRLTGNDTSVVFSGTLVAQAYYFIVKGIGSLLLVGVVAILIQEIWQLRRIVTEIGESDARHDYLIQRAILAPSIIKRGILRAAVTPQAVEKQKRLIVAAKEIGIFSLPQTFCHYVESFDSEVQIFGLDQCLEMFRQRAREFENEQSERTLIRAAHVLKRGKLGVEPTKKLLRLMTSIVVVKRGTIDIPSWLRGMMQSTIRVEIEKTRAKEDPALRGFFRDLQTSLNNAPTAARQAAAEKRDDAWVKNLPVAEVVRLPLVVAEPTRLPQAEDPAVPPDSPAPTVH